MRPGHDQRRRDALVGHVADGDPDPPAGHLDEVVEVASDRPSRAVVGGDLPLWQSRKHTGQELLLDERGDAHLLLETLALDGLAGLLADELGDADGGGGLGGQGRQKASVVRRVVLLGQARAQVERADQLALRDERHDEGDAGLAHRSDRRRVEFQLGDLHRAGGRLQVGHQRIRLGDVDRDGDNVAGGDRKDGFGRDLRRWIEGAWSDLLASQEPADRTGAFGHVGDTVWVVCPEIVTSIALPRSSSRHSASFLRLWEPHPWVPSRRIQIPSSDGASAPRVVSVKSPRTMVRSTSSRRRSENAAAVRSAS